MIPREYTVTTLILYMKNWITEKLNNFPDATQLINDSDGIPNQFNPGAHNLNHYEL